MPGPRRYRNNRSLQKQLEAKTEVSGDASDDAPRAHTSTGDQYQHFIPSFVLRRFQVGSVKSKGERLEECRLTGVDHEYIHYYDIATGSLDIRPIGQVYGVPNFYRDVQNTEVINELEEKLAHLEHQASSVIEEMHEALPCGTFTLTRTGLELLRKFLFIMHYREVSCSGHYFQADHPENANARQWIKCFMKAKGIQSTVETWLHVLRYFLNTSHSEIMRDAAELIEKYGEAGLLLKMVAETHFPPDFNYPAFTYQSHANLYFLSIWEAAKGEEFMLTHNGFGLWEGLANGCPDLHRIFVVSPRIALVLRNGILRPELRQNGCTGPELRSSLLSVHAAPAAPIYADGGESLRTNSKSVKSLTRYMSSQEGANDSFVFKITKLSRSQTLELNSIVLLNVKEAGSLTFLSKQSMLRTARAFRSLPTNFPKSNSIVPLIDHLNSPVGSLEEDIDALSLVDVVLYVLLMQICTGRRQFTSAYDRAHVVLKIMENAKPTSFELEIGQEVEKAYQACEAEFEDDEGPLPDEATLASLLPSIPDELSCQLFRLMIPYMSKLGAAMSGGEGILEQLQDEVVVVGFLTHASLSPGVWHALSCSNTGAPGILSRLFKEGTPGDEFVKAYEGFICKTGSPSAPPSYDRAYALRRIYGIVGPTTNLISQSYHELAGAMIDSFSRALLNSLPEPFSSQPRERPNTQLVHSMSHAHSDCLMLNMKIILATLGFTPSSGENTPVETMKKCFDEMGIINALGWLGRHRRNFLDLLLDRAPLGMPVDFKLFEDEEVGGDT